MFDITPELDITTLQVNHLVNEASSVALVSALREQVTSGLHQSLELVGIRKRGTLFPVQITLKLLGTKQLIIWRDMTVDKQGKIYARLVLSTPFLKEYLFLLFSSRIFASDTGCCPLRSRADPHICSNH